MGAFALTATMLGRFIVSLVVAVCVGIAFVLAGIQWATEAADNPPDFHGYDEGPEGEWIPRHGPRGKCWACHVDPGQCWYCLPADVQAARLDES